MHAAIKKNNFNGGKPAGGCYHGNHGPLEAIGGSGLRPSIYPDLDQINALHVEGEFCDAWGHQSTFRLHSHSRTSSVEDDLWA